MDDGSYDLCSSNLIFAFSPSSFNSSNLGPNTVTMFVADENGNSDTCTATITVEEALATDDINPELEGVLIYPNPATDIVTIKNAKQQALKTAKLYDIRGRLVKEEDLSNMGATIDLNVSTLDKAIYLLMVHGELGSKQFRLVVN
ncbi:T9SS type A sorting domain-containing protein [Aestuariivivens insulae]|uniref:T9SS type A sorting domain-containing protein n=1 Tax=Aestuariivivens insulae TaxID=1621988 RepID=UPI001F57779D|nr:T9SS type A sorting domain-containing protein [Aestuariivivens insulae]